MTSYFCILSQLVAKPLFEFKSSADPPPVTINVNPYPPAQHIPIPDFGLIGNIFEAGGSTIVSGTDEVLLDKVGGQLR